MNVPYRFADNGGALEVPADKVHELRLRLAQLGLPKGGTVGFELLDQEKFGISQFSEQVNYQRALEGELSRTIETLGPVKSARTFSDAKTVAVRARAKSAVGLNHRKPRTGPRA